MFFSKSHIVRNIATTFNKNVLHHKGKDKEIIKFLDKNKKLFEAGSVVEAQTNLINGLQQIFIDSNKESEELWREAIQLIQGHPIAELVHQDPLTGRSYHKPRGYAGDAVMIDYAYFGIQDENELKNTTYLGKKINDMFIRNPAASAVRNRARMIGNMADQIYQKSGKDKIRVLSIACGHLRELTTSENFWKKHFEVVGLDQDEESLGLVDQQYSSFGVKTVNERVKRLIEDKNFKEELGSFDFVYSAGLFDYLNDTNIKKVMKVMYDMTIENGTTLFANFTPNTLDRAYLESFMAWDLIYRTPSELLLLANEISPNKGYFKTDTTGCIAFLSLEKTAPTFSNNQQLELQEEVSLLSTNDNMLSKIRGYPSPRI